MKRIIALCAISAVALTLSGCAILLGAPMTFKAFGGMAVQTRVSTAYLYITTDAPEEIEVDVPFFSTDGSNKYGNAMYNKYGGYSLITLSNRNIEMTFSSMPYEKAYRDISKRPPQGLDDAAKIEDLISLFYSGTHADSSAEFVYDAQKKMGYKCFTLKTQYEMSGSMFDVCGAAQLSNKGNVVFLDFRTNQIGSEKIKSEMLETISSLQFKAK